MFIRKLILNVLRDKIPCGIPLMSQFFRSHRPKVPKGMGCVSYQEGITQRIHGTVAYLLTCMVAMLHEHVLPPRTNMGMENPPSGVD